MTTAVCEPSSRAPTGGSARVSRGAALGFSGAVHRHQQLCVRPGAAVAADGGRWRPLWRMMPRAGRRSSATQGDPSASAQVETQNNNSWQLLTDTRENALVIDTVLI
ncbi:hypothetical protein ABG768_012516 [Culter alburnus]|uniref:Uncharacterized protein n=1 Tax=Culter alburnus TaxID=194366 RepID=A0AAW2AZ97_CULAL